MGEGRGRPMGMVSFLFTDIEGSTPLWERQPDAMRTALARHDAILRSAIGTHGGFVFSTAGDAFSAAFHTPTDALGAAVQAQRQLQTEPWPDDAALRVRMGVHIGNVQERDSSYFGGVVNRAARLMSLARGSQVLVSLAVEELVRDELAEEVRFVPLGEHPLRGLSRPESVFQVSADGLRADFEPIASAISVPGNVPTPVTSFIGRVEEVKRLVAELPARRLLTLVGPGGVGKTRLSIEAAAAVADEFPDGVWFVELAPVAEPEAVVHAVASTLSISPDPGSTLLESVVDALSGRRVLVVLDNCEHVVDAAAELSLAVSRGASMATILATSREPLGVTGEWVWLVPTLDPMLEAAELFVERARAANSAFVLREHEHDTLVELCTHLDGIPLAIELAAGRVRSMTVAELAGRLHDRFRLLRDGHRRSVAENRQRTLLATVEWSYRLLGPDEQLLFNRLSVFASGFDLAALTAVCADDELDELNVIDLIDGLVDRSMVATVTSDSGTRFMLLETLRQYGVERLEDAGGHEGIARRHMAHYVGVAGRARDLTHVGDYEQGVLLFDQEWDNLRAASRCASEIGDAAAACTLVVAPYWYAFFAQRHELGAFAEQALRIPDMNPLVHGIAGIFAFQAGDNELANRRARAGIAVAPHPTHPDTVICWQTVLSVDAHHGRKDELREDVASYVTAASGLADPYHAATAYALASLFPSATDEGSRHVAEAKRLATGLQNPNLSVLIGTGDGIVTFAAGNRGEAAILLREARRRAERAAPYPRAIVSWVIALRAAAPGFDIDPRSAYHEAISLLRQLREWGNLWLTVESLAAWWADTGRLEQAAMILGHLDATGRRFMDLAERRARALALVHTHPQGRSWLASGATATRDQLIAYVLDGLRSIDQ